MLLPLFSTDALVRFRFGAATDGSGPCSVFSVLLLAPAARLPDVGAALCGAVALP